MTTLITGGRPATSSGLLTRRDQADVPSRLASSATLRVSSWSSPPDGSRVHGGSTDGRDGLTRRGRPKPADRLPSRTPHGHHGGINVIVVDGTGLAPLDVAHGSPMSWHRCRLAGATSRSGRAPSPPTDLTRPGYGLSIRWVRPSRTDERPATTRGFRRREPRAGWYADRLPGLRRDHGLMQHHQRRYRPGLDPGTRAAIGRGDGR